MVVETIIPTDKNHWLALRRQDVTSTEVSALFGLSPYMTEFELWMRKKHQTEVEFEENERMKWGTRLQDAIAYGVAVDEQLFIRPAPEYCRIPDLRIGSSFDFIVTDGVYKYKRDQSPAGIDSELKDEVIQTSSPQDKAILEIKNVDSLQFRNGWLIDDEGVTEAPPYIELQVQQQMLIKDLPSTKIRALIGGNTVAKIERQADLDIHSEIKIRVKKFWDSIDSNTPPPIDFERDAKFISKLYGFAEPGKVIEADFRLHDLAQKYKDASDWEKKYKTSKEGLKAEMLSIMGSAEKAMHAKFSISAGVVGPSRIEAFERAGYRLFKVNFIK